MMLEKPPAGIEHCGSLKVYLGDWLERLSNTEKV